MPWPPGLLENRNSLLTGKKTGNFADSGAFCEKQSRKRLGIQVFTNEFPSKQNRELIRDNREANSREQGMSREFREKSDPLAATHPMASKCFLLVETTEYGRTRLASPDRPRRPQIKSAVVHDETE